MVTDHLACDMDCYFEVEELRTVRCCFGVDKEWRKVRCCFENLKMLKDVDHDWMKKPGRFE